MGAQSPPNPSTRMGGARPSRLFRWLEVVPAPALGEDGWRRLWSPGPHPQPRGLREPCSPVVSPVPGNKPSLARRPRQGRDGGCLGGQGAPHGPLARPRPVWTLRSPGANLEVQPGPLCTWGLWSRHLTQIRVPAHGSRTEAGCRGGRGTQWTPITPTGPFPVQHTCPLQSPKGVVGDFEAGGQGTAVPTRGHHGYTWTPAPVPHLSPRAGGTETGGRAWLGHLHTQEALSSFHRGLAPSRPTPRACPGGQWGLLAQSKHSGGARPVSRSPPSSGPSTRRGSVTPAWGPGGALASSPPPPAQAAVGVGNEAPGGKRDGFNVPSRI